MGLLEFFSGCYFLFYLLGFQSHRHLQGHMAISSFDWRKPPYIRILEYSHVLVEQRCTAGQLEELPTFKFLCSVHMLGINVKSEWHICVTSWFPCGTKSGPRISCITHECRSYMQKSYLFSACALSWRSWVVCCSMSNSFLLISSSVWDSCSATVSLCFSVVTIVSFSDASRCIHTYIHTLYNN